MFKFLTATSVAIICAVGMLATAVGLFLLSTPRPTDLKTCIITKMHNVKLCPTDADYVSLKNISIHARNAVIVSEDASFYGHQGFDWDELKVSFERNLEKGEYARGGSTISQQLAKNVYLSAEKSILRKVREAIITIQIEDSYTKDEILEKYLNVVEFGPNLYGIGKAARHYFKKSPAALTPAEGAFLAFLLPSPKKYSVSFQKKALTPFANRQVRAIVDRLYRFKKITDADHETALAQVATLFGAIAPTATDTDANLLSEEETEDPTSTEE